MGEVVGLIIAGGAVLVWALFAWTVFKIIMKLLRDLSDE